MRAKEFIVEYVTSSNAEEIAEKYISRMLAQKVGHRAIVNYVANLLANFIDYNEAIAVCKKVFAQLVGQEVTEADLNEGPLPEVDPEAQEKYAEIYASRADVAGGNEPDENLRLGPDVETLGAGYEAVVYRDPNHPEITKIMGTEKSIQEHGYMQYILMSKKYANSNPYLPRVNSIKRFKNTGDRGIGSGEYSTSDDNPVDYFYVI